MSVALVLGGLVSAVGWLVTPAVRTWLRRRITIPGRYGIGGTVFTGVEAQLWAVVFGLTRAASALGAMLHWPIDRPSERIKGLETVLICGGLAVAFSLLGMGAVRDTEEAVQLPRCRPRALSVPSTSACGR